MGVFTGIVVRRGCFVESGECNPFCSGILSFMERFFLSVCLSELSLFLSVCGGSLRKSEEYVYFHTGTCEVSDTVREYQIKSI